MLDVSAAPAGGVALAGQFRGTLDLDPSEERDGRRSAGDSDAFVVVLDANGDVLRSWTAGGPGADAVLGVASPTDGSLIAVGSFSRGARLDPTEPEREHVSVGETDAFVLRLPTGDP